MKATDREVIVVAKWIKERDKAGDKCGRVLRETCDQLYDGLHTGRYRWCPAPLETGNDGLAS